VSRVTGFYRLSVDTTRFLSVGAVQKADSGHTGVPLAYVLRIRFLKHNPANPQWLMRDGFVL
jgi:transketolase